MYGHPEIKVSYFDWSPSPYPWEALFIAPMGALKIILTRIEREPHQVAFRPFDPGFALFARLPDVLDDDGKPMAAPFAVIHSGLGQEDAETIRTQLKAQRWSFRAADFFKEAA